MKKAQFFIISMVLVVGAIALLATYLFISPKISYIGIDVEDKGYLDIQQMKNEILDSSYSLIKDWHLPDFDKRYVLRVTSENSCNYCLVKTGLTPPNPTSLRVFSEQGEMIFGYSGGVEFNDYFESLETKYYYIYYRTGSTKTRYKNIVRGDSGVFSQTVKEQTLSEFLVKRQNYIKQQFSDRGWIINFNKYLLENKIENGIKPISLYAQGSGPIGVEIETIAPSSPVVKDYEELIPTQYSDGTLIFTANFIGSGVKREQILSETSPETNISFKNNIVENDYYIFDLNDWSPHLNPNSLSPDIGNVRIKITGKSANDEYHFYTYADTPLIKVKAYPQNRTTFGIKSEGEARAYKIDSIHMGSISKGELVTKNGWTYVALGNKAIIANVNYLDSTSFSVQTNRVSVTTEGNNFEEEYYLFIGDDFEMLDSLIDVISSIRTTDDLIHSTFRARSSTYDIETSLYVS